jgi:hypothetical protein
MNIFKLLGAANKELVHSSMVKFFLDNDESFGKEFLNVDTNGLSTHLELSAEFGEGKNKKSLRFDLLLSHKEIRGEASKYPDVIIENKFKATPTIKQLRLYDDYLKAIPKKDVVKILLVFSEEQIPSDVEQYRALNNWKIVAYFSFTNSKSLLQTLNGKEYKFDKVNKLVLHSDYLGLLKGYEFEIKSIINSENLSDSFPQSNREIKSFFLFYLQGRISKSIDRKISFKTGNDGGGSSKPSINFETDGNEKYRPFMSIDDTILKVGFHYHSSAINSMGFKNRKFAMAIQKKLKEENLKEEFLDRIPNGEFKKPIIKDLEKDKKTEERWRACSVFTYDILNSSSLEAIVKESAKLFEVYFNMLTILKKEGVSFN